MTGNMTAIQVGLTLGLTSILSIGPNNITLMREGLARGRVGLVVTLISASQAALVLASGWLATSLQGVDPTVRTVLSWIAVGVLLYFALQSFRAAGTSRKATNDPCQTETTLACVARVLPIVWVNPLSYLEFLFVPAAILKIIDQPAQQAGFLGIVVVMAVAGNVLYGCGGQLMTRIARGGRRLWLFDLVSGAAMCFVAPLLAINLSFA